VQIESNAFFDFRYDLIRSGQKLIQEKSRSLTVVNGEFMEEHHKRDFQIFLPSWWIIAMRVDQFPAGQRFLIDFSGNFVSNPIVF
jgi:hypothetical protein